MAIAPIMQDDERFMAAAIRLSQRHVGATGSNPSVGALIVRFDGAGAPLVVGRGVTAAGGRPRPGCRAARLRPGRPHPAEDARHL